MKTCEVLLDNRELIVSLFVRFNFIDMLMELGKKVVKNQCQFVN